MIRARFSPKAARDLDGIFRFISSDNPDAAQRVRATILDVADFLAQNRELGRKIRNASPRHAQIRWFVVPKFRNYLFSTSRFRKRSWWFAFFMQRRIGRDFFRRQIYERRNF